MDLLALVLHVLNFLAPAAAVAVLTAVGARLCFGKGATAPGLLMQVVVNFGVCTVALVGGLLWFGYDGKMATYAALVLGCASVQSWMLRGGGGGGGNRRKR